MYYSKFLASLCKRIHEFESHPTSSHLILSRSGSSHRLSCMSTHGLTLHVALLLSHYGLLRFTWSCRITTASHWTPNSARRWSITAYMMTWRRSVATATSSASPSPEHSRWPSLKCPATSGGTLLLRLSASIRERPSANGLERCAPVVRRRGVAQALRFTTMDGSGLVFTSYSILSFQHQYFWFVGDRSCSTLHFSWRWMQSWRINIMVAEMTA